MSFSALTVPFANGQDYHDVIMNCLANLDGRAVKILLNFVLNEELRGKFLIDCKNKIDIYKACEYAYESQFLSVTTMYILQIRSDFCNGQTIPFWVEETSERFKKWLRSNSEFDLRNRDIEWIWNQIPNEEIMNIKNSETVKDFDDCIKIAMNLKSKF